MALSRVAARVQHVDHVWNYWIVYPIWAWVLIMCGRAWSVYGRRGITESEIKQVDPASDGKTLSIQVVPKCPTVPATCVSAREGLGDPELRSL